MDFDTLHGSAVEIYLDPTFVASTAPEGSKSKATAGVLALLLGALGAHKFYLGYTSQGLIVLAGFFVGAITMILIFGVFIILGIGIIALIEGITYLTKSDAEFHQIYVEGKKPWF